MKSFPDFSFEKPLWQKGHQYIGGVDEVGRGAFAGPVVAGVVVFKQNQKIDVLINDSKQLTQKQREVTSIWIKDNAVAFGVGIASVFEIDKLGIVKATNKAFRRAIKNTGFKINFLLIDAFYIPRVKFLSRKKQLAIIKGDSTSLSIAAASIIAKVHRDDLMVKLSQKEKYSMYNWHQNKGYGTKYHREAIKIYGKTRLHRVSFLLKLS